MKVIKLVVLSVCLSLGSGLALANSNCQTEEATKTEYVKQLGQLRDSLKASYAQALTEYNKEIARAQTNYEVDNQIKESEYQERLNEITKFANNGWRKELEDLVVDYNAINLLAVDTYNETIQAAVDTYNIRVAQALEEYRREMEKLSKGNSNAYCG
ncbi:MAG: hypothetical protein H6625_02265 [Bdellovibrionaceae bacterium]|nr:hypothetical protein [Pseudobdellovibrionaceae bacterium]